MNPEWSDSAYDDLADIWVGATLDERTEIERAVLRANRVIGEDPTGAGESRGGNVRVVIAAPLTVWYRVQTGPRGLVFGVRRPQPRT